MNRLIRNRDIFVIVLLIIFICLFNFHISQGDRGSNLPRKDQQSHNKVKQNSNQKLKDEDHINISQLNQFNNLVTNDTNITISTSDLLTTPPSSVDLKRTIFNELVSAKDYRKICSNNKSPIVNINLDDNLFNTNNDIECPTGSFIVFLVVSDIEHFESREKIRQSWSSIRQLHEAKLTTLFFVYSDRELTDKQKQSLKLENDQYYDIVYIPIRFTPKTELEFYLKMFQFSVFNCMKSEYFVLVKNSVFVNLPTLFEAILTNKDIKSKTDEKSLMLCKVMKNVIAVRNKKSSWYVSNQEWSEKHYPIYCDLSNGIVMSQSVARDILMCSYYMKRFWINDVFISGILPQKLSINVEAFMEDFSTNIMRNHYINDLSRNIFLTDGMHFHSRIWRLLFSRSMREF